MLPLTAQPVHTPLRKPEKGGIYVFRLFAGRSGIERKGLALQLLSETSLTKFVFPRTGMLQDRKLIRSVS